MSRPLYVLLIAAPLAVLGDFLSWPSPVVFGLTLLIFAFVAMDGRSNWLEGAQLPALFAIIAVVFFFLPIGAGAAAPAH